MRGWLHAQVQVVSVGRDRVGGLGSRPRPVDCSPHRWGSQSALAWSPKVRPCASPTSMLDVESGTRTHLVIEQGASGAPRGKWQCSQEQVSECVGWIRVRQNVSGECVAGGCVVGGCVVGGCVRGGWVRGGWVRAWWVGGVDLNEHPQARTDATLWLCSI